MEKKSPKEVVTLANIFRKPENVRLFFFFYSFLQSMWLALHLYITITLHYIYNSEKSRKKLIVLHDKVFEALFVSYLDFNSKYNLSPKIEWFQFKLNQLNSSIIFFLKKCLLYYQIQKNNWNIIHKVHVVILIIDNFLIIVFFFCILQTFYI